MTEELTPYATFFRYPGDILEPTAADAQSALSLARDVVADVTQAIGGAGS